MSRPRASSWAFTASAFTSADPAACSASKAVWKRISSGSGSGSGSGSAGGGALVGGEVAAGWPLAGADGGVCGTAAGLGPACGSSPAGARSERAPSAGSSSSTSTPLITVTGLGKSSSMISFASSGCSTRALICWRACASMAFMLIRVVARAFTISRAASSSCSQPPAGRSSVTFHDLLAPPGVLSVAG